jgi:acetyl esterase/lipase
MPKLLLLAWLVAHLLATLCSAADYQIRANIHYDQYPETVLDILQPPAPALTTRPGVIVIHGGGWIQGSKEQVIERFCVPFVQKGFVVANVEYRLAAIAAAPAALNDVLKAAQWFHDHAADYKVDEKKIVVTGGSAGGHLALMVGMLPASAGFGPETRVAAVVNFYGITDVPDQLEGANLRDYAVTWIPEQPDRMDLARRLSPLTYVRKKLPPVLTIHGDADPIVPFDQGVRLNKALKEAHDDTELIAVAGGKHGFTPDQMDQVFPKIFAWLKKHKIS